MFLSRLGGFARCIGAAGLIGVMATGASAADRGLSLTIGLYREVPALQGVSVDRANARAVYSGLGFGGPLQELTGVALDLAGLRTALGRLVQETEPGDRVFLYYAGLGTGRADPANPDRCERALLAQDGQTLGGDELALTLQALERKAAQVVVVLDACPAPQRLPHACLPTAPWAPGAAASRVVVLAPACTDAPLFGATPRGRATSQALTDCLAQADFAGNPLASFEDLQDCADRQLARQIPPARRSTAPLLLLAGNAAMPVHPQLESLIAPSAAVVASETPMAALQRVAEAADAQWRVDVVALRAGPRRRPQAPALAVTSGRDGFLYLMHADAETSQLSLVYPQHAGDAHALRAGRRFEVPRRALPPDPSDPDRLLVLVSDMPLRAGDLMVQLGLGHYAAAACLRNLGSNDCPSTAAGTGGVPVPLRFGVAWAPPGKPTATTP